MYSIQKDRYHHGDLKNALLQAAETLLAETGAAGLSLRAVAKAAGVSHTAPYRHFKDKAALLRALAQAGFERLRLAINAAADAVPHDAGQKLIAAGSAYVTLAVRNPELTRLMFGGVTEPGDDDASHAADAAFESLVWIITAGVQAGAFRDRDPYELALVAWTSMHGLAMLIAAGLLQVDAGDEAQVDTLVRSVAQNLLYGISK
ncbi:MAG: TetR/AcrR family transcriptional regulator [Gammaproteobacteria bacterium]